MKAFHSSPAAFLLRAAQTPVALLAAFSFLLAMPASSQDKKSDPPAATAAAEPRHVDAAGAKALLDATAKDPKHAVTVLDIRTAEELKDGRIKGAQNIDFMDDDFEKNIAALDRSKTYLVHCQSGGRSTKSLDVFKRLGFKSIIHMDGGMKAWNKAGLPVEK
jgi:phage shock protein E